MTDLGKNGASFLKFMPLLVMNLSGLVVQNEMQGKSSAYAPPMVPHFPKSARVCLQIKFSYGELGSILLV